MTTVHQAYDIDAKRLETLAKQRGKWWGKSFNFYCRIRNRDYMALSEMEKMWLFRIEESLEGIG